MFRHSLTFRFFIADEYQIRFTRFGVSRVSRRLGFFGPVGLGIGEFEIGRGGLRELTMMVVGELDSSTSAAADKEEEKDG
jgi:hypothetical protein